MTNENTTGQVYNGGRYCLTYEEWRDDAIADPEAYGLTEEQRLFYVEQRDNEKEQNE
jgi:hypothetical protein